MSTETEDRKELLDLLKKHAIRFGRFTLASGAVSSYYIDAKLATLIPRGFQLIGKVMAKTLEDEDITYDAVGGLESGAIAIACSVASARPTSIFFVRRNKKEHGTQKWIEGPLEKGRRALIVEDVVTTGGFGAEIVKVLVLVDRLQGAKDNIIRACGTDFSYEAIFSISDLGVGSNNDHRIQ
jgi:orotate phosphoribosyltransferase